MEPAHTVDVDGAVVHPDTLQQVGGSGRSLADKHRLVKQIEYVAHCPKVLFLSLAYAVASYGWAEFATATSSRRPQPALAVSEKSFRTLERSCHRSSFELARPG